MKLSLALLLNEMDLPKALAGQNAERLFSGAELSAPDCSMDPDLLLITTPEEALHSLPDGICRICCGELPEGAARPDIVCVPGDRRPAELANRFRRTFAEIGDWMLAMERCCSEREGLQRIMDLSAPIFRNFITVQDGTFKLLAYTKSIAPPSRIMADLVHYGYHRQEAMDLFRRTRKIEEYQTLRETTVSRDHLTSCYDVVRKTFSLSGSLYILIIMDCCGKPADAGTVEKYEILAGYVKRYIDREVADSGGDTGLRKLALDILAGNIVSEGEARTRAAYCNWNDDRAMQLFLISFSDSVNLPHRHLVSRLRDALPDATAFSLNGRVVLLRSAEDNHRGGTDADIPFMPSVGDRERSAEVCSTIGRVFAGLDFICGISSLFRDIWELTSAYKQAEIASEVAGTISGGTSQFMYFSNAQIYALIHGGAKQAPGAYLNSLLFTAPSILRAYDEKHHTNVCMILRVYLDNERRATETAEILHLHRNTVLHHMARIEEYLGISLDDNDTRLLLQMAFRMDDLGGPRKGGKL